MFLESIRCYHVLELILQIGMRGAFGKPIGKVARVKIGTILYSVRVREGDIKKAM